MTPVVELQQVSSGVLRALDVRAYPGERVGVIAEAGSGKTVLAELLVGVRQPRRGRVRRDGRDVTRRAQALETATAAPGVGWVPQPARPFPRLSVYENVLVAASVRSRSQRLAEGHARRALERLGLDERAEQLPAALGGADSVRLDVARVVAAPRRLVVVDQLADRVDDTTRRQILDVLDETVAAGAALVWLERPDHPPNAVDRLLVLAYGRIAQEGPPDQVLATPQFRRGSTAAGGGAAGADPARGASDTHGWGRTTDRSPAGDERSPAAGPGSGAAAAGGTDPTSDPAERSGSGRSAAGPAAGPVAAEPSGWGPSAAGSTAGSGPPAGAGPSVAGSTAGSTAGSGPPAGAGPSVAGAAAGSGPGGSGPGGSGAAAGSGPGGSDAGGHDATTSSGAGDGGTVSPPPGEEPASTGPAAARRRPLGRVRRGRRAAAGRPALAVEGWTAPVGARPTFSRVDLEVALGEIVAVVSPSSAPTSLLLDSLAGLVEAEGVLWLGGRELTGASAASRARAGLAYLPREGGVADGLTVEEHLSLAGARRWRRRWTRGAVFGLFPSLAAARLRPAGGLPALERRCLALGRALVADPQVVLVDEPVRGLATRSAPVVLQALAVVARTAAVVLAERPDGPTLAVADRVEQLDDIGSATPRAPAGAAR